MVDTIQLPREFKEFIALLNSEKVDYLLVGGWALALHGHPRYTGDIDIWIRPSLQNAEAMIRVLRRFGFASRQFDPEAFVKPDNIFRFGFPPMQVDIINTIAGVDFAECFENRLTVEAEDVPVNVICVEDFKKNKIASGRPQDLADAECVTRKTKTHHC
jgi:hypothetical protein